MTFMVPRRVHPRPRVRVIGQPFDHPHALHTGDDDCTVSLTEVGGTHQPHSRPNAEPFVSPTDFESALDQHRAEFAVFGSEAVEEGEVPGLEHSQRYRAVREDDRTEREHREL